jgi:hypothetical protein
MSTIEIHDEELASKLRQIAEREHRPVEDVLKSMVERYPVESPDDREKADERDELQEIRHKIYKQARTYWESAGDAEKAALSDAELDEQFAFFDEEGIPRVKSEVTSWEPPVGSLAYAAKIIREEGGIHTGGSLDVTRADEILNEEFADYLLNRMRRNDADEASSG